MPPRPRKGHRKSRNGCGNCKKRKIKCNESKPECVNCIKHRIRCDYMDTTPATCPASASVDSQGCTPPSPPDVSNLHNLPPVDPHLISSPPALPQGDEEQSLPLNVVDLELMYNFITSTSHTMSPIPEVRNLWRVEVPRIAFRHDFVLRALLAVSALHTAQWKAEPEERDFYIERALAQHRISLREPMEMLHNLSPENASALFVFAILTAVIALATPRKPDDFLIVGNEGITHWLFLLRGTSSIVSSSREWILSDTIASMIHQANVPLLDKELEDNDGPSPVEDEQFGNLRRFLQRDIADPEERRVCFEATDKLSRAFAYFARGNGAVDNEVRSIFVWIYKISDDYLALLTQYRPHAMIVLGYYGALLHRLDSLWWVRGWGTHLIALVYRQLDSYHRSLLRWPIEEIGWVPT